MGIILGEAFSHISALSTFDLSVHKLQTNKKTGTLSIRHKGRAFVLLQVMLPRKNNPDIAPAVRKVDELPPDFPGVSNADVVAASTKAQAKIATMSF